jgi:hypothetical protein
MRITRFAAIAWMLVKAGSCLAEEPWFADVERYTSLRDIRLDVAGPEPASFTALGVAPFVTGQALASADMSFSLAQVVDDYGNPRAAFGIDFAASLLTDTLLSDPEVTLGDYARSHSQRVVSRLQLSVAVSKGESSQDRSTRIAPTLRIVFHEQRDPRVHRGPGSLQDCFERHVTPPSELREQQKALAEQLKEAEALLQNPALSDGERAAALRQRDAVQAQWNAGQVRYRAALQETVRKGMRSCRDDSQVAAYTWNATGFAIGISPTFRNDIDNLGSIKPKGLVVYATEAFGFDRLGTLPTYHPSFLGAHAQVLTQILYRLNDPQLNPLQPRTFTTVDELVGSLRLRAGTSPWNGNLEVAEIHDWFAGQRNDTLTKISIGMDVHVSKGTWLSVSAGRTFWRDALPNETSAGLSIKWTKLN